MKKEIMLKRVLPIALIAFVLCLLLWLFFLKETPPKDPDALWSEKGDVIAIIDGKEYRYDPVYLFRLTNCVFDEDYKQRSDAMFGFSETYSGLGVFFGETLAESAVCLELIYQDARRNINPEDISNVRRGELSHQYRYMHDILKEGGETTQIDAEMDEFAEKNYDEAVKINESYKQAKFSPFQTDEEFLEDSEAYLKKFAYIDEEAKTYIGEEFCNFMGIDQAQYETLQQNPEEMRKAVGKKLMEKYDVEMVK